MVTETKHYVEYLHASIPFFGTSVEEIPEKAVEKVTLTSDKLAFRFFDKNAVVIDGETLTGEARNRTGWYFRGEKLTSEEIQAMYGTDIWNDSISRLAEQGYHTFVKTHLGQFFPLEEGDTVI